MATVQEIAARILRETPVETQPAMPVPAPIDLSPEPWPTRAEREEIEQEMAREEQGSRLLPTKKVTAGIIAGAVASIAGFLLSQYNIAVPPEVVASATTVLTFVASYFVPEN